MDTERKTKINRLVNQWPKGTVGVASYLNSLGFSYELLRRYKESGWIEKLGRGAYILSGDKVTWPGALYTLQTQLGFSVHAGGKTALELKGYAHYVPEKQTKIFLYGQRGLIMPGWLKGARFGIDIVLVRTNLFPMDCQEGLTKFGEMNFPIRISAPERAAMEMLHLVPREVGFEEASLIMENLVTLRPDVTQKLLETCRSVKVKRLFLYMTEKHEHPWLSQLNLSQIDLGKGKRMIIPNGQYDRKYRITVPIGNEVTSA